MNRKPRTPFKFNVGEIVKGSLILEQFTQIQPKKGRENGVLAKAYKCKCTVCQYEYDRTENTLELSYGEDGCACCKEKIVVEHINSIVANEETHWMVDYFPGGWNEAKLYISGSEKKVTFKCPHCGKLKDKPMRIADLHKRKTISCTCQGGRMSYGERVCKNALDMIGIDYITQYRPTWNENRFYDFFIPSLNCIIEIHGEQHYRERGHFNIGLGEQQRIDADKEAIARANGVVNYFQVNCSKSQLSWIRENLSLVDIIDWSVVNWKECSRHEEANIVKEVCQYKENNPSCSCKELTEVFSLSTFAIKSYLKKGYDLGWCSSTEFQRKKFIPHNSRKVAVYYKGEFVKEYNSCSECAKLSESELGIKFSKETIRRYCEGIRTPKGERKNFMFMFIN